jgi:hypothetical protein
MGAAGHHEPRCVSSGSNFVVVEPSAGGPLRDSHAASRDADAQARDRVAGERDQAASQRDDHASSVELAVRKWLWEQSPDRAAAPQGSHVVPGEWDVEAALEQAVIDREVAVAAAELAREELDDLLSERRAARLEAAVDRAAGAVDRSMAAADRGHALADRQAAEDDRDQAELHLMVAEDGRHPSHVGVSAAQLDAAQRVWLEAIADGEPIQRVTVLRDRFVRLTREQALQSADG